MRPSTHQMLRLGWLFPVAVLCIAGILLFAGGSEAPGANDDAPTAGAHDAAPSPMIFIEVVVILLLAKLGGHLAIRFGQPSVLGELGAGMAQAALLGSIIPEGAFSLMMQEAIRQDSHLNLLAQMGVVLLLFRVGLESDFADLVKVGGTATLVAITGVVLPMTMGYLVCSLFVNHAPANIPPAHMHLFVGATMAATSVGITARIFEDLRCSQTREARIVLGAAVIDDVLGLLAFAVVSSLAIADLQGSQDSILSIVSAISANTVIFFSLVAVLGRWIMPPVFRVLLRMKGDGVGVAIGLVFCFAMAYLSELFHLAPIVGAFLAGLMIDNRYFPRSLDRHSRQRFGRHQLEQDIDPIYQVLAPVFFVVLGMQVDLGALTDWDSVGFTLALLATALVTKVVAGLWVSGTWRSKITVGVGMIPRGEVGLIFASMGLSAGFIGDVTFSAIVLMVFATTLSAPFLLKWILGHRDAPGA